MYAHVHLHRRPTLHELSHDDDDVRIASDRLLSYNGPEEHHWDPNVGAIGSSRCEVHNRVRESVTVGAGEPVRCGKIAIVFAGPWPWRESIRRSQSCSRVRGRGRNQRHMCCHSFVIRASP